jgi:hypothetical protein
VRRKAAAAGVAVFLLSCGGAYLTAPPGSTMTLVANPMFIASHGGVSELMAIVTEPAGTDVPDGTVVLWTTTLGHVDRETRTQRGIARNRLISDSRSGPAIVTAASGADALPPTTTPSPPPSTTTPTSTLTPGSTLTPPTTRPGGGTTATGFAAFAGEAAQNSASVEITIGNALVRTVRLRANPPRITISNSTHVIATVLDQFGNPVANVPVFFEVVIDADTEFFDSGGAPVFTNNNGEAEDVLRTRRTTQGTITVRAVAPGPNGFVVSPPHVIEVV